MSEPRLSPVVLMAAVVPACLATLAVIVFTLFEWSGRTLSSEGPSRNLAEAAAIGSASEVVRFLQAGEDPNQLMDVRPFVISSSIRRVTGLEAAIWYRSVDVIQLFDRAGAIADDATRRHLTCLAAELHVDDVVEYLAPDGAPRCVPGQVITEIESR